MTPDLLWQRYARIWSSEPARRAAELEACLTDGCSYCDVNGLIEGARHCRTTWADFSRA